VNREQTPQHVVLVFVAQNEPLANLSAALSHLAGRLDVHAVNNFKQGLDDDFLGGARASTPDEVFAKSPHERQPLEVLVVHGLVVALLVQGQLVIGRQQTGQLLLLFIEQDFYYVGHEAGEVDLQVLLQCLRLFQRLQAHHLDVETCDAPAAKIGLLLGATHGDFRRPHPSGVYVSERVLRVVSRAHIDLRLVCAQKCIDLSLLDHSASLVTAPDFWHLETLNLFARAPVNRAVVLARRVFAVVGFF